ncbi:f-box protein cpr30, partial [Nicotiana attenuata]
LQTDTKGKSQTEEEIKELVKPSKQMEVVDEATAVHFPEEILGDILSRLTVRSLLRFECVSKFWNTLISKPYFKTKHLNHAKNDQNSQKFLICQKCPKDRIFSMCCCPLSSVQLVEDVQKLDCPSNSRPGYCEINCFCNGLAIITVDNILDATRILLLWNPSTRESIVLPNPQFSAEEFSCFGLAYDSTSGDYKILIIHDIEYHGGFRLPSEILALKSGLWRKIDKHPCGSHNVLSGMHSLAFVHEAFHWIGKTKGNYFVVSFGISNEVYGEIPLPLEICLLSDINVGVSVLEGMLCAYSTYESHQGEGTFKLWVMKDYHIKESWNALFTIRISEIYVAVLKYRFADGELLFWCIHYQCGTNVFRTSREPSVLWPRGGGQKGFAFTESLISPKLLT